MAKSKQSYESIFERKVSPFLQASIIAIGVILIMFLDWAFGKTGIWESKDVFAWELAFSGILFYAFFNAVFSLAQKGQNYYFLYSVISYFVLVVFLVFMAYVFSSMTIDEAGEFRWMLMIFTFSYLLLTSIFQGMRKVVQIAQKQDAALRGESNEN